MEKNNYIEHHPGVEEALSVIDYLEVYEITSRIEMILRESLCHLLLFHYIQVDSNHKLIDLLNIFTFIETLEDYLDSDVLLHYVNDEIDAKEQLLVWCEILFNEWVTSFDEIIEDVRPTFINNVKAHHEKRIEIQPLEYDNEFHHRVSLLKDVVSRHPFIGTYVVPALQNKKLIKRLNLEELYQLFKDDVYGFPMDKPGKALLGIVLFSDNNLDNLRTDVINFSKLLYSDMERLMLIDSDITQLLKTEGQLCKQCSMS